MKRTQATKDFVFQAADELHSSGQTPTIKAIRESLGCGSNTTIHKYLSLWKKAKANETEKDSKENNIEKKLKNITQELKQQQRNNQQLCKEILGLEHKLVSTEQELNAITTAFNNQTIEYNETKIKLDAALKLNEEIQTERNSHLSKIFKEQQKLVKQFQDDLKQINQDSLEKVSEISIKNQDAWIAEKVKNKNLETTITELKTKIFNLEKALQQEKELNKPLRNKLLEQEKLLSKYINSGIT